MPLWQRKSQKPARAYEQSRLGPLETEVMSILWTRGRSNVREVAQDLARPLAYTTVMTTLDRLFKKGLLQRDETERAFFYAPLMSRQHWEQQRAGSLISGLLSAQGSRGELLVSCLVDAFGDHDLALLDELERQIALKRRELESKGAE